MRLYIDLDILQIIQAPGLRQSIRELRFRRGDTVQLEVIFCRGSQILELPIDTTGRFGIKETGKYNADYLASDLAWTKSGAADSTVYTFNLNLNTAPINEALHTGPGEDPVAQISAIGEIEWNGAGIIQSTLPVTVLIDNDINKGTEGVPQTGQPLTFPPSPHHHNAADIDDGVLNPARLPASGGGGGGTPWGYEISSGTLSDLTIDQQAAIQKGWLVTTSDGNRWQYTGTGDKTFEASYIKLAKLIPDWADVANKPSVFSPAEHSHTITLGYDKVIHVSPSGTDSRTGLGKYSLLYPFQTIACVRCEGISRCE